MAANTKSVAPFPERIPYSSFKEEQVFKNIPIEAIQRAFLALTVVAAVISLIPHLGYAGSLTLRSVAFVSSGVLCMDAFKREGVKGLLFQVPRIALVALGLIGVAMHMHALLVAAVITDMALQVLLSVKGLHRNEIFEGLSHLSIVLIDSFVLAGMLTGMWQYMVTASTLSAAAMIAFAIRACCRIGLKKDWTEAKTQDWTALFEVICYTSLAILGIAGAVRASKITEEHATKYYFQITNNDKHTMNIYDSKGHLIATLKQGESVSFSLKPSETMGGSVRVSYSDGYRCYWYSYNEDTKTVVIQPPMASKDFHSLPVGGASVVVQDPWPEEIKKRVKPELNNLLKTFMEPSSLPILGCPVIEGHTDLQFVRKGDEKNKFSFDFDSVCERSAYFQTQKKWLEQKIDHKNKSEFSIEADPETFRLLMQYFNLGDLKELDKLSETQLIDLHDLAEFYGIPRLIDRCIQEITTRLVNMTWKGTSLFEKYQEQGGKISTLVKLFDFK